MTFMCSFLRERWIIWVDIGVFLIVKRWQASWGSVTAWPRGKDWEEWCKTSVKRVFRQVSVDFYRVR